MTLPIPSALAVDLRVEPVDEVLDRVEQALRVRLQPDTVLRKRRSVGARTDRDTWVRIERRPLDRIGGQGWNGTECAAALTAIDKPTWRAGLAWRDASHAAMWRADETSLLPGNPVGTSVLATDPGLPASWWQALNSSLDALAGQHTTRIATPDTVPIGQAVVTKAIRATFPGTFDTTVTQWAPAHADLNWANVTGPRFCLFDWEDWGNAPRGLDSASLWANSLAVPALADRVRRERGHALENREGRLMMLFACSKIIGPDAHPEDPRVEPARHAAARIVARLQAG
ncbi:hypothetical protein PUR61_09755 [Streptomyces sp. BE20]|uniref:hypothetical protein n=1 Tax=Streptomyces sp. BE20 TaxID=3002525 RepID=UPI002E787BE1|nr:hypothetical protein [Streptomyces sp. BE20]MEE1822474.1 hypothetical protein [Streptomyces sp. BE20]